MDGEGNLFPVSPNFPVKCEQRQAVRSPGGRLSGPPPPRQPLVDRGPHQVHHLSSSLSTLATGSGGHGLMPSFAEAAGAATTSVTGSWSGFASRPAPAADSSGRVPAAASSGAPGVALLPSYHNHMRASSAGISGGAGSTAVHGPFGRTGPALLLPVVSGTDRPGVAATAAAAGAHGLPPGRRHDAGCNPFGATLDFQPISFAPRLLPLPNGATIIASNPPSSRSLMPRQPKVFGSDQPSTASRPPSLPANDAAIRPAAVRQQLQPQQYVPSSLSSSSASLVAHDQLLAPDNIGSIFCQLTQSGSANGSSDAIAGASWSAGRPNPLMHGHFNEWAQPVATAGRVGQPARNRPAAASSPSPGSGASRRNGDPAGVSAVPGAALLKMAASSKGAPASTVVTAAAASPLACAAAGRAVAGRGVSAAVGRGGVAIGDRPPTAAGSFPLAFPDSKVQDRLPPLLFVKRQVAGLPLLPEPRDDSGRASAELESASDRLSSPSGLSASSGCSTVSGVVPLNQVWPTPRAMMASAASASATSVADRAVADASRLQPAADAELSDDIAIVTSKPPLDIRRHVIEGFVIEESSQPFPVTRSSLLTSLVLKRKRGQAGRRNVRLSVAGPQTDSSSRASSPLTASPAAAAATPDSVTAASGLLPCLLPPPLSPAARTEAAAPPAPHCAASAAAGAEARGAAALVSSKPSRAELPEPSEWSQDAAGAASAVTQPAAKSADAPAVCTFCGRNEVRVRAFSGKTFCSKSCAAAYRRSYNADGSPVAKRRRAGRPPGSSSKLAAEVTTKQKPAREKSRQRRFSGGSGEAVGVPSLDQQRSDLMATQPGNGENSEPDSPASAGSGGVQATDECLSRSKILSWNVDDVYGFISAMDGCSPYADEFRSQEIDGRALLLLSEDHLVNALSIKLGPALKIISAIGPFQ